NLQSLFAAQVTECLSQLSGEVLGRRNIVSFVAKRRHEIPDTCPRRFAFLEFHLADFLDAADLDALHVVADVRIQRPFMEGLITGQMSLNGFARLSGLDLTRGRGSS